MQNIVGVKKRYEESNNRYVPFRSSLYNICYMQEKHENYNVVSPCNCYCLLMIHAELEQVNLVSSLFLFLITVTTPPDSVVNY